MLALWSANLEKGRHNEYEKWVVKNIGKFRKYYGPLGWKLKGIYASTANLGPYDVTWVWEFNKFQDIDKIYEISNPRAIKKLQDEESAFYIPGTANTVILKEIRDGTASAPAKRKRQKK